MRVRIWVVAAFLAAVAIAWWLAREVAEPARDISTAPDPERDRPSRDPRRMGSGAIATRPTSSAPSPALTNGGGLWTAASDPRPRAPAFDPARQHSADPCTALVEPEIPTDFERLTRSDVTVAWHPDDLAGPRDVPLRPVSIAYLAAAVLEEAADLLGTNPRGQLVIIIDRSLEAMHDKPNVPSWASGYYDGGAVHVPARIGHELGVSVETLRHEILHAQVHAAIGCTPFWFDEGVATMFAGGQRLHQWVEMLRAGGGPAIETLHDPSVVDLDRSAASRAYAMSLAMIVHLIDRGGEHALRSAVQVARGSSSRHEAARLWAQLQPDVEASAVLDTIAKRVFGRPRDGELTRLLEQPWCCKYVRTPADVVCQLFEGEKPGRSGRLCRRL